MNLGNTMNSDSQHDLIRISVAVALAAVLASAGQAQADDSSDVNVMCPVLQDRAATADYAITWKGKEIRFCCSECVMEFQQNPEIYENAVPQLQETFHCGTS